MYVPDAIAWTEAPETVRALTRQRSRWAYGTLQCLWKHRDMVFNWNYRALGWFSLPSIWFFQIILVAITPMVDLFLLASLPFGVWNAVLPFIITFLAMDVLLATLACILEREPILRAWRILPMRLIYRPDAQLLHLESHPARHQRRLGQLGQTRAHRQRARASVIRNSLWFQHCTLDCPWAACSPRCPTWRRFGPPKPQTQGELDPNLGVSLEMPKNWAEFSLGL